MIYDFVELVHIKDAILDNNIEKAKKLYFKWKLQDHSFILNEDIIQLEKMLTQLNLPEEKKWLKTIKK